jgi:hypothetical protein
MVIVPVTHQNCVQPRQVFKSDPIRLAVVIAVPL